MKFAKFTSCFTKVDKNLSKVVYTSIKVVNIYTYIYVCINVSLIITRINEWLYIEI